MTKWEYKFVMRTEINHNGTGVLDDLGKDGWELVLYNHDEFCYLFKRPV